MVIFDDHEDAQGVEHLPALPQLTNLFHQARVPEGNELLLKKYVLKEARLASIFERRSTSFPTLLHSLEKAQNICFLRKARFPKEAQDFCFLKKALRMIELSLYRKKK
jgi:hypothetical protein